MKNYGVYSDLTKRNPFSTLKTLFINYFVNQKIEKIKTEEKNNIVYKIDCSDCEAVYFGKSKRSLKSRFMNT